MLTMVLAGDCHSVEAFATHLKAQPFMNIIAEDQTETGEIKLHFTTNIFKPTQLNVIVVALETTEGNPIHIELLNPVETQVDEHTRQITGTSYDIFATPQTVDVNK
jgi:hypothetical protein